MRVFVWVMGGYAQMQRLQQVIGTIYYKMFLYIYHPYSNCNHVCLDYLSTQKNVPTKTHWKTGSTAQVVREKMMDFEVPRDLCALEERETSG